MISVESHGDFKNLEAFLKRMQKGDIFRSLSKYGEIGANALSNATPRDSGETAQAWYYEIVQNRRYWGIIWKNRNVVSGRPIAILLQYGHGTGTGGYVQGRDYINPAIRVIFERIADEAWREVTRK